MKLPQVLSQIVQHPSILLPREHLFLVSHMRANTSLFGHILGSHPDISGYYELHIGYYSWKSLLREKLIYFTDHDYASTRFMFDKVLHNEHEISDDILSANKCRFIFSLRHPEQTIKSIVSMYQKKEKDSEYCDINFSTSYYIDRLQNMAEIASKVSGKFFYLDSEALIKKTEESLSLISNWLNLSTELSPDYNLFAKSGAPRHGDPSQNIKSGTVLKKESSYEDISMERKLLESAVNTYMQTRETLVSLSAMHLLND